MRLRFIVGSLLGLLLPLSADSQSNPISSPLKQVEILGRLTLTETPNYIGQLVKTRDVSFAGTEDFLRRVREAGGAGLLMERLAAAEPPRSPVAPPGPRLEL